MNIFKHASFLNGIPALPHGFSVEELRPSWVNEADWQALMNGLGHSDELASAYAHLVFTEDMIAIHEDHGSAIPDLCETWLAHAYHNSTSDLWKRLVRTAWRSDVTTDGPGYFRPSCCLVSPLWLDHNGFSPEAAPRLRSLTFRDQPSVVLETTGEPRWVIE